MEVIEKLLGQLHTETGEVYVGQPPVEIYSDPFLAAQSAARLSWANYARQQMYSKVNDIFSFQIMTTTTCKECNLTKNTFSTGEYILRVGFHDDSSKDKKTVSELIHDYFLNGV